MCLGGKNKSDWAFGSKGEAYGPVQSQPPPFLIAHHKQRWLRGKITCWKINMTWLQKLVTLQKCLCGSHFH